MKKNAKLTAATLSLLVIAVLFGGLYLSWRPDPVAGCKTVMIEVVHSDETTKSFSFQTELEYLGELLLSEGLVKGDQQQYGLYITEVDGEVADYSGNRSYWALYEGDSYATQGADTTPVEDGDQFTLVYTIG